MATKKQAEQSTEGRDERASVDAELRAHPTASDTQIAAAAGVDRAFVIDVRAELGAKHTWPQPKEERKS